MALESRSIFGSMLRTGFKAFRSVVPSNISLPETLNWRGKKSTAPSFFHVFFFLCKAKKFGLGKVYGFPSFEELFFPSFLAV